MGEYNQIGESGEKLLHLEVFTYDNIEQFKAKAEAAYKQDKEKKGIKDNFLYVARGSQLYSIANDEAVALEKTQVEIMVPLSDVAKKTVKDKQNPKKTKAYYNVQPYLYSFVQKNKDGGIYVDDSHLTHGLLFPGVNVFNQTENGLCIFKHGLHQHIDPKSDLTIEQKNELDPMFKSIMDELDLDKDKNAAVSFEAGKLKDLLLSPVQQRRLTGIVAKHDSEWKKTRAADFKQVCDVYRNHGKEDRATRIVKRVEDLSIKLEVDEFNTDKQAYYLHPLGMIGWLRTQSLLITPEMVNAVAAGKGNDEVLLAALNKYAEQYEINTLLRIAHFLAQCAHESGGFTATAEGTSFSRAGAGNKFKKFVQADSTTKERLCPIDQKYCNQPDLFNYVYANSNGNGSETSGDGYKYRGGGYIQITGREKYKGYTKEHNAKNPSDQQDFEANPNLVRTNVEYGVESAMFWWRNMGSVSTYKDCNRLADLGATEAELIMMSANVNGWFTKGGTQLPVNKHGIISLREANGMSDRRTRFNSIKKLLGL